MFNCAILLAKDEARRIAMLYPQDGLDTYAQSTMSRRVRSTAELDANKSGHPGDHSNDVEGCDPVITSTTAPPRSRPNRLAG